MILDYYKIIIPIISEVLWNENTILDWIYISNLISVNIFEINPNLIGQELTNCIFLKETTEKSQKSSEIKNYVVFIKKNINYLKKYRSKIFENKALLDIYILNYQFLAQFVKLKEILIDIQQNIKENINEYSENVDMIESIKVDYYDNIDKLDEVLKQKYKILVHKGSSTYFREQKSFHESILQEIENLIELLKETDSNNGNNEQKQKCLSLISKILIQIDKLLTN
jgi:hypothetical protein